MANTTVNIDIQVQSKSIADLEQQLAEVNDELKQLPIGSEGFNKLSKESQELTKQLDKANEAAEGLTDDKKFLAAEGSIKVLGGSLAGVVGVLGTIGVESEAFGELERKAASAIAVAVGVRDIAEGMRQLRQSTVLATAATKIFGNVSRKALIATGIGAFVVALGTVVAYWDDITEAIGGSNKSLEDHNEELQDSLDLNQGIVSVLESEKGLYEAQGTSTIEVNKKLLDQLDIQIAITEQLIAQKQLQLADEQEQNAQVTFWEKIKLGIFSATGAYGTFAQTLAESVNPENEKTRELATEINEQQVKLNELKTKYIGIEEEYTAQVAMANAEDAVTVSNITAKGIATFESGQLEGAVLDENTAKLIQKASADRFAKEQEEAATAATEARRQVALEAAGALGGLSMALGQGTAAGKAAAIAEIAITTGIGFAKALEIAQKSAAGTGPAAAFAFPIFYASQLAAVLGAVGQAKEILSGVKGGPATPVSIVGGGAPSAAGTPGGIPQGGVANLEAATPQFVDTTPTIQAYVLSGNVTSAQEADAKLSTRRQLG